MQTMVPTAIDGVNDAVIIDYTHIHDGGDGQRPYGIAICLIPRSRREFVTWRVYVDEYNSEKWHAEIGHYTTDFLSAVEDYQMRSERGY